MITKIFIIESLPNNELQTGEELFNNTINNDQFKDSTINSQLIKVNDKDELFTCLTHIERDISDSDEVIVQIEAHGNNNEMGLKNSQTVTWKELTKYLIPINKKCRNKLHLNLATCYSMHAGLSIDLKLTAPYKTYISTIEKIKIYEIMEDNKILYKYIMDKKELFPAYLEFMKERPTSKFRIKDVMTVLDYHLKPNLLKFLQEGSDFLVKSFFEPYLNIEIDLKELEASNDKVEYVMSLFKKRFIFE